MFQALNRFFAFLSICIVHGFSWCLVVTGWRSSLCQSWKVSFMKNLNGFIHVRGINWKPKIIVQLFHGWQPTRVQFLTGTHLMLLIWSLDFWSLIKYTRGTIAIWQVLSPATRGDGAWNVVFCVFTLYTKTRRVLPNILNTLSNFNCWGPSL